MPDRREEEQILQRAIEKGLIGDLDLQGLKFNENDVTLQVVPRWGLRIDRLVQMGRLSEKMIERLSLEVRELAREREHADTMRPGTVTMDPEGHRTLKLNTSDSALSSLSDTPRMPSDSSSESGSGSNFPVVDWERFQMIRLLGIGGMGSVYQAQDPILNRVVALKFIRGGDPKLTQRFMQEAKAQARIDHEHICKVYEVGEIQGKPYIAMQYIDGVSVHAAKKKMSLEQKVKVIKDAATALHAAHRLGIIHRDIKPSNIMVERREDGDWQPCVMDFGLARDSGSSEGLTETGMIIGTPSYMSPEQAKGDVHHIDRRSDIYSIGATLYDLLANRPPFIGGTGLDILMKVVDEEPEPLRKIVPTIPADLETITLKCLEKDPKRRYHSAKALAEDLQHYLDGEPITAQQLTWRYRIIKRVKKHRVPVLIGMLSFIAIMVLLGFNIHARYTADGKARFAQLFGQEAERIEGILQRAYLLPLHDIRREQQLVQTRMNFISEQIDQAGNVAVGAGHYALGRGYLALHKYEDARFHLELARKNNYSASELAYPLGLVMGELYREKLAEAERRGNRELLQTRKQEIDELYRKPALQYLNEYRSSGAQVESAAYLEGQIAFYQGEYQLALQKTREAFQQSPWLYEALRLEGNIHIELGKSRREKGDYEGAMADYLKAGEAYEKAAEIAHSDAAIYTGKAEQWTQVMEIETAQGRSPQDAFEHVITACDQALQINPENMDARNKKSRSYRRWGEYQDRHGEDPRPIFEQAITIAEQAIKWNEQDTGVYENISNAYRCLGEYEMRHGLEPFISFSRAINSINKGLQLNPNNPYAYHALGLLYDSKGLYERNCGQSPYASWDLAIANYQKFCELRPTAGVYNNIGAVFISKAQYQLRHGIDPAPMLARAQDSYNTALQINPNLANGYIGLGLIAHSRALYQLKVDEDALKSIEQAIANYQQALKLNPNNAFNYNNLGYTLELKAQYQLRNGFDPLETLEQARKNQQRSQEVDASDAFGYAQLGMIELMAAARAVKYHESPQPFFAVAESQFNRARELDPRNNFFYQTLAMLHYRRAETLTDRRAAQLEISRGLDIVAQGIAINLQNAEAIAIQGALYLLKAQLETAENERVAAAKNAKESLAKALELDRFLQREYGPLQTRAQQLAAPIK